MGSPTRYIAYWIPKRVTRGRIHGPEVPTRHRHCPHMVEGEGANKNVYGHPHELASNYVRDWGKLWTQAEYATWRKLAHIFRALGWHHRDMEELTTDMIRNAIYSLKPSTAVGVDQWRPNELR